MKKNRLLVAVVMLLSLLAVVAGAVRLCRHYLPQEQPSCALFERYKDNPAVKATLLRDFRVSDTLAVDVLLLEAATDSAWCELQFDFGVPKELMDLYQTNSGFFEEENRNSIIRFYIDINNPQKRLPRDNPDSRIVIGSHKKRTFCVFMTKDGDLKKNIGLIETLKLKE